MSVWKLKQNLSVFSFTLCFHSNIPAMKKPKWFWKQSDTFFFFSFFFFCLASMFPPTDASQLLFIPQPAAR